MCLLQKSFGGPDLDVWLVDDLRLMPVLPKKSKEDGDKVLQASINVDCDGYGEENRYLLFKIKL